MCSCFENRKKRKPVTPTRKGQCINLKEQYIIFIMYVIGITH